MQASPQYRFRKFSSPSKDPTCPLTVNSQRHSPTRGNYDLLSAPINLPFLGISYTWEHTIFNLFAPGFFTWLIVRFIQVVAWIPIAEQYSILWVSMFCLSVHQRMDMWSISTLFDIIDKVAMNTYTSL